MKLSPDFLEKLLLLAVTAAVTGLLVPYVLKRIDESKSIEQKRLEADISRQAKLIEAQSKFLDETTEALWNWRYLSMKVAYNGSESREEQYSLAVSGYEAGIWDILNKIRSQTSKSRRLVSEKGYKNLVHLYKQIVELDAEMDGIVRQRLPPERRAKALAPISQRIYLEMSSKLDDTLDLLAQEVGQKAPEHKAIERE